MHMIQGPCSGDQKIGSRPRGTCMASIGRGERGEKLAFTGQGIPYQLCFGQSRLNDINVLWEVPGVRAAYTYRDWGALAE